MLNALLAAAWLPILPPSSFTLHPLLFSPVSSPLEVVVCHPGVACDNSISCHRGVEVTEPTQHDVTQ